MSDPRARLAEAMSIAAAEGTVTAARMADLVEAQRAAWARHRAAKGQVTRAMKDGSAGKIATARRREADAYARATRTADAAIGEMLALNRAGLDNLGRVLDHMGQAWEADAAAASLRPDGPGPYVRCPACGFTAPPESMDYALAADDGIDWGRPVRVTCMICHAAQVIGVGDVQAATAAAPCTRCATVTPCTPGAARVQCTSCGVFLIGPDLDAAQRAALAEAERAAGRALYAKLQAARHRVSRDAQ